MENAQLNQIQDNPIKTENASLSDALTIQANPIQESQMELMKTKNDSLDNDKELDNKNKVAFGDTAHIEMKSQHLILKTAIAHCFRISVTTLYDAMQQTAAL